MVVIAFLREKNNYFAFAEPFLGKIRL